MNIETEIDTMRKQIQIGQRKDTTLMKFEKSITEGDTQKNVSYLTADEKQNLKQLQRLETDI